MPTKLSALQIKRSQDAPFVFQDVTMAVRLAAKATFAGAPSLSFWRSRPRKACAACGGPRAGYSVRRSA